MRTQKTPKTPKTAKRPRKLKMTLSLPALHLRMDLGALTLDFKTWAKDGLDSRFESPAKCASISDRIWRFKCTTPDFIPLCTTLSRERCDPHADRSFVFFCDVISFRRDTVFALCSETTETTLVASRTVSLVSATRNEALSRNGLPSWSLRSHKHMLIWWIQSIWMYLLFYLFFVSIVSIDHELAQRKAFLCCRCLPNCDCDCSCQGRSGCGDCRDKRSTQEADFRRSLFKIIQSPFTLKFGKTLMRVSGHNSSTSRKGLEKMLRSSTTSNIQAFATGEHDLRRNCEPFLSFPSSEG